MPGNLYVVRIDLYSDALVSYGLRSRQRRPGPGERIQHDSLPEGKNGPDNLAEERLGLQAWMGRESSFGCMSWR